MAARFYPRGPACPSRSTKSPNGIRTNRSSTTFRSRWARANSSCCWAPPAAGKSTLLRAIAGLTGIDHGRISLHGRDVTHVRARDRGVGLVFQNYALFRHMTVADNIEFALRVRRMKARRSARAPQGIAQAGGARRHGRAPAGPALRRPAAARGRGARAGAQAAGAAARRALRRAGRQDPRRTAPHHPLGAARARHHHGAGHARPGRSLRAGRHHRRHESRPPARSRASARSVRAARHALRRHVPRRRQPAAGAPERRWHPFRRDAGQRRRRGTHARRPRARSGRGAAPRRSGGGRDARAALVQLHCARRGRGDRLHRRARAPARAAAR